MQFIPKICNIISAYVKYTKYLINHKYLVYKATRMIHGNIFKALVHDLSKFHPTEFHPYAMHFFGNGCGYSNESFDAAWNRHQKRNKHHWQYWALIRDGGEIEYLDIPKNDILDFIADLMAMEKEFQDTWDFRDWFDDHENEMIFSKDTKANIDTVIDSLNFILL